MAASAPERAAFLGEAAAQGEPQAQALYAQLLLDGDGVERDPRAAFAWFNRAAAARHLMALNMVGRCYDLGWGVAVDKQRAGECFRIAAERGLGWAMYNYATALALGAGVDEDKSAALAWLERAIAAAGDAEPLLAAKAMNFVGSFAEDGWAGPIDMLKAARCYAEAANGGDFRAQFNHARMLIGAGDVAGALPWLARSGQGGTAPFVVKAIAWLRATGDERLAQGGVAAMRDGC